MLRSIVLGFIMVLFGAMSVKAQAVCFQHGIAFSPLDCADYARSIGYPYFYVRPNKIGSFDCYVCTSGERRMLIGSKVDNGSLDGKEE